MNKRILIIGKGGSGKDHLKNKLIKSGYKGSISHTTRPIRNNEVDGVDYHFTNDLDFSLRTSSEEFREWTVFKGWFYGTTQKDWEEKEVFIVSPEFILNKLTEKERESSFIIYLDIDEDTRRARLIKRNDSDSVDRRIDRDDKDFIPQLNKIVDLTIKNSNF